jgi:ribosomal protein L37AE/L43A
MPTCPKCGSLMIRGHEIRGVYDGVLFWSCDDCRWHWARDWSGFGYRRQQIADEYVANYNRELYRGESA